MTAPLIASLDIAGRDCLVVGGGRRALAAVQRLLDSDAVVTVVAPRLHTMLRTRLADGVIRHHATTFAPSQLAGMCLTVPATGDRTIDEAVRMAAAARGIAASRLGIDYRRCALPDIAC